MTASPVVYWHATLNSKRLILPRLKWSNKGTKWQGKQGKWTAPDASVCASVLKWKNSVSARQLTVPATERRSTHADSDLRNPLGDSGATRTKNYPVGLTTRLATRILHSSSGGIDTRPHRQASLPFGVLPGARFRVGANLLKSPGKSSVPR